MAGIYIHIPFCRKFCSYCDFYKTAVVSLIPDYLEALKEELVIRSSYLQHDDIETLYLGGGTPSLLTSLRLREIFKTVYNQYTVLKECEVTLEANPDDLTPEFLRMLASETPVNRLSIGIQSFNQNDLQVLNRRHTALQALRCIEHARSAGFQNISIDLIYGLPGMTVSAWQNNLETAFSLRMEHLSAYHLTIEPRTALARQKARGLLAITPEDESTRQFFTLNQMAVDRGYIHYEISNLALEGFHSQHNTNYWARKKYLGAGPSSHSYDLVSRQWNVSDVRQYIKAMAKGVLLFDREELLPSARFNEYLMVSLRTAQGVNLEYIRLEFGEAMDSYLVKAIQPFLDSGHLVRLDQIIRMTLQGWLISDYILSGMVMESDL